MISPTLPTTSSWIEVPSPTGSDTSSWVEVAAPTSTSSTSVTQAIPTTSKTHSDSLLITGSNSSSATADIISSPLSLAAPDIAQALHPKDAEFFAALRRPYTEPIPEKLVTQALATWNTLPAKQQKLGVDLLEQRYKFEFEFGILNLIQKSALLWFGAKTTVTIMESCL